MKPIGPNFDPKTFRKDVEKALATAMVSIDYLIDAYQWWLNHPKLVPATNDFSPGWLETQIQARLGFSLKQYLACTKKLGGGQTAAHVIKGREIITQVGVHEALRATKRLSAARVREIIDGLNGGKVTVETFHDAVTAMEAAQAKAGHSTKDRFSWKAEAERWKLEAERWKQEALKHEVEVKLLREIIESKRKTDAA